MIRVIIVENEPQHYNSLKELLAGAKIPLTILSVCADIDSAYADITRLAPDLVFLDIDLGGEESGFDLLQKFEKPGFAVIFTTQYINTTNAIGAIRACAIDFLPKPLMAKELDNALARAKEGVEKTGILKDNLASANGKVLAVCIRSTDGVTKLETDNIIYCRSDNSYTFFNLNNPVGKLQQYISSNSIREWEMSLEKSDICRVHNQYLVNLKFVSRYTTNWNGLKLKLQNGMEIPVSKSRKKSLLDRLKQ